mmetsp:Transcript_87329/g.255412  ORF Transcript_87329/g.255412 Transcript_87329/m.255412 type:complete len:488 (-) Transcript_87329:76-1539(-)
MTASVVSPLRHSFLTVLAAISTAISVQAQRPKAHYWPSARGHIGEYFLTAETLPRNLSSAFSWKFQHPEGRFRTVMRGNPLIDSESNVLILTENGLFKLSPEGRFLWAYVAKTWSPMNVVPCIMDDVVYGGSMDSTTYAVDLQTGKELWSRRYSDSTGVDTHYVDARQGILLAGVDHSAKHGGGNLRVLGINASTSDVLWELKLDLPTWNFSPLFPGDGSFIFMDISGGVHRVMHHTGERVWYTPVPEKYKASFTDGGVSIAPDGSAAFACSNAEGDWVGALRAYRISDGVRIWEKLLPTGCTSWPVIAKTSDWGVLPAGSFINRPWVMDLEQWMPGQIKLALHTFSLWMGPDMRRLVPIRSLRTEIIAFDTKTGATRWNYRTPNWQRRAAKGDEEGFLERATYQRSLICLPTSWGTPTMSGDDTVYVGHVSGLLYAVKDHNGDDHIDPTTDLSTFDMDAAPLPNNPAWAPGMMAVASCDTLFVFKS